MRRMVGLTKTPILLLGWVPAVAAPLGCSSREVPATFPAGSPASLSAPEGRDVSVARALEADPPLPGESTEGWAGLEPSTEAAPSEHENEHEHEHEKAP